ncbi:uncharacterized protein LOC122358839 [Puntigrus tetrazona]|uniref:uncharacterized protein LOC122358839 n=1 Tax=Puntigrus tetrazona TaxID=1606681 RepID=UPI001C8A15EF|nr:uncharacterized protein LOC122358839 [Puntigrus tetrazona]
MKFAVFLSGSLLLFLLSDWTESVDTVDIKTLARIINFFEQNYKRVDENGNPHQYAVAINVPKHQCQQNFKPTNFLTKENATKVRNAINNETNGLYIGRELIAAGRKKVAQRSYYKHSEYLLLNPVNKSPMTRLLNYRKKDSCSVFYTFYSPCVKSCLNATSNNNILGALRRWNRHGGIKAFVFKNIYVQDLDKDLQTEFLKIAAQVPLYRCPVENQCYACYGEQNDTIDARCLPQPSFLA